MSVKEATNLLTKIQSKTPSEEYKEGWERIFGTKPKPQQEALSGSTPPLPSPNKPE